MERYASCYLALGGEPTTALDSVIAVKMLTTVLNLIKHNKKEGDEKFFNVLSNIFGDEEIDACRKVIDASAVDAEEGWQTEDVSAKEEDAKAADASVEAEAPVVAEVAAAETQADTQPETQETKPAQEDVGEVAEEENAANADS